MKDIKLKKIIEDHKKWLSDPSKGKRANLGNHKEAPIKCKNLR